LNDPIPFTWQGKRYLTDVGGHTASTNFGRVMVIEQGV